MKTEVDVFQFKAGVDFLKVVYLHLRKNNPRFSRRAFAAKLGMDQSMLTRYFGGVRLLASERVEDVARHLELGNLEAQYFKVITLLGDRGELDILEKLRRSLREEGPFNVYQITNRLREAGWWQNTDSGLHKDSGLRLAILRRIFSMGSESPTSPEIQSDTVDGTQVQVFNQIINIRKEDREIVENSLQELYKLLNSVQVEEGDDFLVISTTHLKTFT